jgi:hypothetical protein
MTDPTQPTLGSPAGNGAVTGATGNPGHTYEVCSKQDMQFWMKPIRHCLRCRFTECSMMGVHREVHCAFYE